MLFRCASLVRDIIIGSVYFLRHCSLPRILAEGYGEDFDFGTRGYTRMGENKWYGALPQVSASSPTFKFIWLFKSKYAHCHETVPDPMPASSLERANELFVRSGYLPKHFRLIKYFAPLPWYSLSLLYIVFRLYFLDWLGFMFDRLLLSFNIINLSFRPQYTLHHALEMLAARGMLNSYLSVDIDGFFDNVVISFSPDSLLYEFVQLTKGVVSSTPQGIFFSSWLNTYALVWSISRLICSDIRYLRHIVLLVYVDNITVHYSCASTRDDFLAALGPHLKSELGITFSHDALYYCSLPSPSNSGSHRSSNSKLFWHNAINNICYTFSFEDRIYNFVNPIDRFIYDIRNCLFPRSRMIAHRDFVPTRLPQRLKYGVGCLYGISRSSLVYRAPKVYLE